ncbi:cupin domain-containing protein [Actinacidiphila sp. ITFR-21]|uniref:cupin domain-containing protein n=1 Tax=Actinacidiphila sp. ITFR-21 TaxID=3075199 RepID=UPI002889726C|nr:cupin domain-containing protein [Streptomyces sp. ITFR-21]WNI16459.1 cupin domain-containing protein [Streptomyces sp. ITFR-21]
MTDEPGFAHVRQVDFARFAALGPDERLSQKLLDRTSGADEVAVKYIRTPPGGGSPEGLHTHAVQQVFFVLAGTMTIEVDGAVRQAPAGSLVVFPKGVPHRNWNDGDSPTVHLAIDAPAPELGVPFARPVG